ncbi:hypothetical protein [Streptomyces sp. S1]|uniref:hypothetical protein n=1 Tax=Streptomyces sp. S1 TaxID=718288 RepID=UPI003D74D891
MTTTTRTPAATALDGPIEQVVGNLSVFQHHHAAGLLTGERAALAEARRDLAVAETAVDYHRNVLMTLASGTHPVDAALLDRIRRTVRGLDDAVAARDKRQAQAATALEALKAAAPEPAPADTELTAHDLALLLSLAGGGTLRENLHTHRVSVRTTQGRLVDYAAFQRLRHHGLVALDTARPPIVGQPVALTDAGRSAITGSRRPSPPPAAPAHGAGAWPTASRSR